MKTTGVDHAGMIPAGAVVEAASWHVAGLYGPSEPYSTERDALAAGIEQVQQRVNDYNHAHGDGYAERYPFPDRLTLELRWKMRWTPPRMRTAGMEFPVARTEYESLAEAREHVARIDKYAGVGE